MDISSILNLSTESISPVAKVSNADSATKTADGTLFDSILNSAIDTIKTTNYYNTQAKEAKIAFALGETESTHDLTIALQKASTALQYTVAVRDKFLEAYREIMNMQI